MEWRKVGVHGRKWLALKLQHSNPAIPWFYVPPEDQRATHHLSEEMTERNEYDIK
jgi:hypothetical protein